MARTDTYVILDADTSMTVETYRGTIAGVMARCEELMRRENRNWSRLTFRYA